MGKNYLSLPTLSKRASKYLHIACFVLLCFFLVFIIVKATSLQREDPSASTVTQRPAGSDTLPQGELSGQKNPETEGLPPFLPHAISTTQPSNMLIGTGIMVNGQEVDTYKTTLPIDFALGDSYTKLSGVTTFRGNHFRDGGSYGTAVLTEESLTTAWTVETSALEAPDGAVWTGTGWTGQPLLITWPHETKQSMNMYDWAKAKENLTEVIYPAMDGFIYFLELQTGEKTRDPLYLGYTFKGAGSLDPRGYPILYLGAGYNSEKGTSRAFVISLIDGSILYEFGNNDTFALRGGISYFDAAPLIDTYTDRLIYPGENGILYVIHLNTKYDAANGSVRVSPDEIVKWRYHGKRSGGAYWLGMESSPVIYRGHIFLADNGGHFMCIALDTMEVVWVQDVLDDTNTSPVLEIEDGHPYLYISTSFHAGWREAAEGSAVCPIWKIDGETGEIVWRTDYDCYTVDGASGGVMGTIALGKNQLNDLLFVPLARTPTVGAGQLVALDKATGNEVWVVDTQVYSWSSPTLVYDEAGKGYIIFCTAGGYMYLLDGRTKEKLDAIDLGGNIESSPAVYDNTIVVGTRRQLIYGITMK